MIFKPGDIVYFNGANSDAAYAHGREGAVIDGTIDHDNRIRVKWVDGKDAISNARAIRCIPDFIWNSPLSQVMKEEE